MSGRIENCRVAAYLNEALQRSTGSRWWPLSFALGIAAPIPAHYYGKTDTASKNSHCRICCSAREAAPERAHPSLYLYGYPAVCRTLRPERTVRKFYWYELIERSHCASILALLRTERWLSAAVFGAEYTNFLAFAAAFRGRIRVSRRYSLCIGRSAEGAGVHVSARSDRNARPAICDCAGTAARGRSNSLLARPVELARGEGGAPDSHTAKTMQEYLNALEGGPSGRRHDGYAELCNVTHPAADSVLYLLERGQDGSIAFCTTADEDAIVEMCERSSTVFAYALSESLMYPVMILKIVNQFQIPELQTLEADSTAVVESLLWDEINEILRVEKEDESNF